MSIPKDPPGDATSSIRVIWAEVYKRWANEVTSWGVFNCRVIAGTTEWSQHAWGNAWDIHSSSSRLDDVAAFLRGDYMARWVAQVLWKVPDHYDHVHVSGAPMHTGTPPCAGGIDQVSPGDRRFGPEPLPSGAEAIAGESAAPYIHQASKSLAELSAHIGSAAGQLQRLGRG